MWEEIAVFVFNDGRARDGISLGVFVGEVLSQGLKRYLYFLPWWKLNSACERRSNENESNAGKAIKRVDIICPILFSQSNCPPQSPRPREMVASLALLLTDMTPP